MNLKSLLFFGSVCLVSLFFSLVAFADPKVEVIVGDVLKNPLFEEVKVLEVVQGKSGLVIKTTGGGEGWWYPYQLLKTTGWPASLTNYSKKDDLKFKPGSEVLLPSGSRSVVVNIHDGTFVGNGEPYAELENNARVQLYKLRLVTDFTISKTPRGKVREEVVVLEGRSYVFLVDVVPTGGANNAVIVEDTQGNRKVWYDFQVRRLMISEGFDDSESFGYLGDTPDDIASLYRPGQSVLLRDGTTQTIESIEERYDRGDRYMIATFSAGKWEYISRLRPTSFEKLASEHKVSTIGSEIKSTPSSPKSNVIAFPGRSCRKLLEE